MGKTARKHFLVDSWIVAEDVFLPEFSKVAESVFSLGNEYMGARGFLDERTSAPSLVGTYLNGIYEYGTDKNATAYKGIVTQTHFMVNVANYFDMSLNVNGTKIDMATTPHESYKRWLNMQTGKLFRTVTWIVDGVRLTAKFCRFLDMQQYNRAYQQIVFTADKPCCLQIDANVRFDETHFGQPSRWQIEKVLPNGLQCKTQSTNQTVACLMHCDVDGTGCTHQTHSDKVVTNSFTLELQPNQPTTFTRFIAVTSSKQGDDVLDDATSQLNSAVAEGYTNAATRNDTYWQHFWQNSDIQIEGDEQNQQGIRFCIFQLQQTYHGANEQNNIGAKGLTGEAYSGHAFWDTETYCLPYYLFNNLDASRNLLEYRCNTLNNARKRAKDLDCNGACYPIATLNGDEACSLWQHASLQMQPSTGVAYGIYHYYNVSGDKQFLYGHGAEMLAEICRYLVTRGQWDGDNTYFGYYCVMGPDEFQMMVNHNTYTNYMAQKTLRFTLQVLSEMPHEQKIALQNKINLRDDETAYWQLCADKMKILYNPDTLLYEQHDGFFHLPHVDVDKIPDGDFPLYSHWSYDRIYRNDMIKQPDVLMFQLLYNSDFSVECKRANYLYYEPRCIHESSLSPSVHSILATEIGRHDEAYNFFAFATRMDLDDYNRNTHEGLHTTSISAAWLNIVYGFAGLRSDKTLSVAPVCPNQWNSYTFRLTIHGSLLTFKVDCNGVTITNDGEPVNLVVYNVNYNLSGTTRINKC